MGLRRAGVKIIDGIFAGGSLRRVAQPAPLGKFGVLDPCVYCGEPSTTNEHIIPQSQGGSGNWQNIARACLSCNTARSSKPLLKFMVEGGLKL